MLNVAAALGRASPSCSHRNANEYLYGLVGQMSTRLSTRALVYILNFVYIDVSEDAYKDNVSANFANGAY